MNILMLSDVYFPRVNGVSSSIRCFARELARLGHAVTVVVPSYGTALDLEHADEPFEIVRLAARVIFFDPEDRLITAAALRSVAQQLAGRDWDIIHIHTPFRAHTLGVRLGRLLGCAIVETYHTYFEQYAAHYLPWLPAPLLRLVARRFSRRLCNAVDHLVVPSAEMAAVLTRYGVTTAATVLPTGIDPAEFANGDGKGFRARHGIAPDRPTLVTVSRLAREKNIGFLIEVTRALVAEFPEILLIVAGEGPDAPRLAALVRELGLQLNVRFFGNLDRRGALLDCYRAGDLFVFASPTETQGLVLIEAMALGVPIVSTAVMGTVTVLRDARCARIAKEDVTAFRDTVAELLRSAQTRAELAGCGPHDATRWAATGATRRLESLYSDLSQAEPDARRTTGTASAGAA